MDTWSLSGARIKLTLLALASGIGGYLLEMPRGVDPELPSGRVRDGSELVMVVILSSTCSGTHAPGLMEAIRGARSALREEAHRREMSFQSIGISVDRRVQDGLKLLEIFGPFDEVLVGGGQLGTGALKYVWQDLPGPGAFPHMLVLERTVSPAPVHGVFDESVRVRKTGALPIIAWARYLLDPLSPPLAE